MKLRELNRILALSLAVSLVTPVTAFASEPAGVVAEIPDGCYYDEEGVLRNADGSVYVAPTETAVVNDVVEDTANSGEVVQEDGGAGNAESIESTVSDGASDAVDGNSDVGSGAEDDSSAGDIGAEGSGDVTNTTDEDDSSNTGGDGSSDNEEGNQTGDGDQTGGEEQPDGEEGKQPDGEEGKEPGGDSSDNEDDSNTDEEDPNKGVVTPEEPEVPADTGNTKGVVEEEETTPNAVTSPARRRIQMPVVTIKDFRFYTIEKEYAFAKEDLNILEEQKDDARVIGTLKKDGRCFVIKDVDENWTFVESGDVRGFVQNEKLALNEEADAIVEALKQKAQELTDAENAEIKKDLEKKLREEFGLSASTDQITKTNSTISESSVGAVTKELISDAISIEKLSTVLTTETLGKGNEEGTSSKGVVEDSTSKGVVEDDTTSKGVVNDESTPDNEAKPNGGSSEEAPVESEFDKKLNEEFEKVKKPLIDFETLSETAEEVISWKENKNIAFARGTIKNFVAQKDYALVTASTLNVREGKGTDTRVVAQLPNNALVYQLADKDQEWVYIESGDVRGFVYNEWIQRGEEVDKEVAEVGEDNFPKVNEIINYSEVESTYYVRESIKEGKYSSKAREQIVQYASQFIGNPYVWGGTDPVNGADCSGFVQSIYSDFGYSLPRVAEDQAYYGTKIAVEDALPGDLIFYMNASGYIYHVVMYAGDGMTVEAANSRVGIINGTVSGDACWATRIINENDDITLSGDTVVRYADSDEYGQYLGTYKLTYYCACEICCGDYANGITATGTTATEGRTIAVDPRVIPYGSEVIINGRVYVAEDCGGAIKGNRIDVYMNSHEECLRQGVTSAEVYLKK